MSRRHVIAIDGPAASGKSTTAAEVARRLSFLHVNSGLFYRALTWAALRGGWIDDPEQFRREVREIEIAAGIEDGRLLIRIGGEAPDALLAARDVSNRVSEVAADPEVRARVLELLRATAEWVDVVCDGRDIGTVVFPDAPLKVFLVADAAERARRRLLDYGAKTTPQAVAAEVEVLRERDRADSTRALSPLSQATDAVAVDTTDLSLEEAVDRILDLAQERGIEPRNS